MNKTCRVCGKEFESSQAKAAYCCHLCRMEGRRQISAEWAKAHRGKKKPAKPVVITDPNAIKCTQAVKKKCQYGAYNASSWLCEYILKTGHRRECPAEACNKFKAIPKREKSRPFALHL